MGDIRYIAQLKYITIIEIISRNWNNIRLLIYRPTKLYHDYKYIAQRLKYITDFNRYISLIDQYMKKRSHPKNVFGTTPIYFIIFLFKKLRFLQELEFPEGK